MNRFKVWLAIPCLVLLTSGCAGGGSSSSGGSDLSIVVPPVTGLTQAAASAAITGAGLTLGTVTTASSSTVTSGNVISESPAAGSSVVKGSAVNLVVSTGPQPVIVPDVTNLTQAAATAAITAAGLTLGTVAMASSSTVVSGSVISESPAAGSSVAQGSAVNLVVSTGPAAVVTLSITVLGPGMGHIVSSPAGIDCGGTCSASFPAGTTVTLTATAAPTPFTGWTGDAACSSGIVVLSASVNCTATFNPGPSVVSFSGTTLMVQRRNLDGSLPTAVPYLMQGVVWSPASTTTATTTSDSNNVKVRRPEFAKWANIDVPLIAAMNANTVRIPIDPGNDQDGIDVQQGGWRTLDTLYRNNIMVIMTVDDAIADTNRITSSVKYYMNHPAVLMFSLGSEWNINDYFGAASSVANAASMTEQSALLVKSLDTNHHPVATSYGDIAINSVGQQLTDTANYVTTICPDVDVWGLNIYRGDNFGTLFQQWQSITTKPMFLGEFGADAFHSTATTNPPPGQVNEAEQASWDISLWNDVLRNSSSMETLPAVGGTVFSWNDEWWKCFTDPSQGLNNPSQSSCGYPSGGFPDGFSNEAYSGVVDIQRTTRQAYSQFKTAFAPGYTPAPQGITFTATSAGFTVSNQTYFCSAGGAYQGAAEFDKGHTALLLTGGGACGGRGFSVAAINPNSGDLISYPGSLQTFDTYASRDTGVAMASMINFIESVPDGTILLIAVADEAGLNNFPASGACTFTATSGPLVGQLETLGSTQIINLCFQGSFAMISVKGKGLVAEQVANSTIASVQASF